MVRKPPGQRRTPSRVKESNGHLKYRQRKHGRPTNWILVDSEDLVLSSNRKAG